MLAASASGGTSAAVAKVSVTYFTLILNYSNSCVKHFKVAGVQIEGVWGMHPPKTSTHSPNKSMLPSPNKNMLPFPKNRLTYTLRCEVRTVRTLKMAVQYIPL